MTTELEHREYYVPLHHYGPYSREHRCATRDGAMLAAAALNSDTVELRRQDRWGDRPLRRWTRTRPQGLWVEMVSRGGRWRELVGPGHTNARCSVCGGIAVSDGTFPAVIDHATQCPEGERKAPRAEVTVNGKVAGQHATRCAMLVLPPDFYVPDELRRHASSTWTDGTGTTTMIFPEGGLG